MPNTNTAATTSPPRPAAHPAPPATSPYRLAVRHSLPFPRTTAATPVRPRHRPSAAATAAADPMGTAPASSTKPTGRSFSSAQSDIVGSGAGAERADRLDGGGKGSVSRSSRRRGGSCRGGSCRGTSCRGVPYPGRSSRWIRTVGSTWSGARWVARSMRIVGSTEVASGAPPRPVDGGPGRDSLTTAARRFESAGRARRDGGDRRPGLR